MDNDWNHVRRDLDKSDNFEAIFNSPWYTDAVYDKFSDAEFARRHALARKLMERDGFDALILTGGPDIYSHYGAVCWGSGLIDDRAMCQYMVLPLKGEPTLIYPHYGCHIEAARKQVSVKDVRSGQHGKYGKAMAERLLELKLNKARIGITAANRTGPEFMGALLSGEAQISFSPASTVVNNAKQGKVRMLAVSSPKRLPNLPDLPTIAETVPGYAFGGWQGIFLPAGASPDIVRQLNATILKAVNTQEFKEYLAREGSVLVGSSPDEFSKFMRAEVEKLTPLIRASGARAE